MIDLHIHTVASDGQHTGAEIVSLSRKIGLSAIAIADHNSVDSVAEAEAQAEKAGIGFAPAIEIDTLYKDRDLHLLGYFIDYRSQTWQTYMEQVKEIKLDQTKKRVEKLCELGFVLEFKDLLEASGGRLPYGVEYMAALMKHEKNKTDPRVREYIDGKRADSPYKNFYLDWLKAGRPAFVPIEDQSSEQAMDMIKKAGGVPVLAHPSDTPVEYVHELADLGLMGLEVYSSYHDPETSEKFLAIAESRSLLVTAGSDFHGDKRKPEVELAGIPGNDDQLFTLLRKAAGR